MASQLKTIELLQAHQYDIIVVDESLQQVEVGPAELASREGQLPAVAAAKLHEVHSIAEPMRARLEARRLRLR